jgi:Tfp pilus assembly protein PilX
MIDRRHPRPTEARRPLRGRRGASGEQDERGSAFIVALLVLVVLTIVGLALTFMTQTEMRIGANEREANRTFYASDSGIQVSTAATLWTANTSQTLQILLNTTVQDTGVSTAPATTFYDQIVVTPLYAIHTQPCKFCQINQNQQVKYTYTTHVVNVTTSRTGSSGPAANPFTQVLAQKVVASMIGLQPSPEANAMVYNPPPGIKY